MFKLILLILQISKSTRDSILKDSYKIDSDFFFSLNNPIVISILLTIIIFAVTIIFFKYIIIPMNKKHFGKEQSLKFEHSRLMALFTELDPNPVFRFDTEGKITMANKVGLEIFGSNFLYESKLSQIIPELKEFDLTSLISEGKKFNIDTKINDRYLQFTICGIPELKIGQIYGTNITERKILEMELSDSEKRYRTLVETSPDAIIVTDLNGNIITTNQSGLELLDCEKIEDVFGKNFIDFIIHEERMRTTEDFQKIFQIGPVKNVSYNLLKKDGTSISVELNTSLIFDTSKKPSALICVARDITERELTEEILWKSEEKYRNLYEAIDQGTALCEVLTDKNGKPVDYRFLDINNKYTMLTGLTRKMVIRKRALEINPQIEQYRIDTLGNVALTGKSIYYEDYFPQYDKYYSVYAYCPIKNQFAVLISDITERKQAEEIIKESEEKYRLLFENESDAIMILDIETSLFEDMNEASLNLFGYEKEEFLKLSLLDISVEPEKLKSVWEATKESEIQKGSLSVFKKKSGETFMGEISMGTFISKGKHKTFGVARDISERIRREKELKNTLENNKQLLKEITRHKKTLQKLSSSLTTVHELERKTISQELHDEIGQTLSAININLVSIEEEILPTISQRIKERFKETKELLETVLNQIQEISLKLRPLILDDLGLIPTLRWYISKYIERSNINVDFKVPEFYKRLNPEFELTIYRVVQEALTNVVRHSQAKNVKIVMKMRNNCLEILIEDDGIGFNFNDVFDDLTTGRGIGIIHIQERIASLGGEVNFQTRPGRGTKIIVKLTL